MRPYPKYKPTGIEWIGEIPEHWEIRKLKYISDIKVSNVDKKSVENERKIKLCNYVDVYKNEFISDTINFMEATANESEIDKFTLHKDDVVITKDSEDYNDIAKPAYVRISNNDLICGYHLAIIRANPNKMCGEYLFRLFQSKKFNAQYTVSANGITRYGLSVDTIKNSFIPLMPVEEQCRIKCFLDEKTVLIDSLIIRKQKLIELLQEEIKAIINEAVTKGLKPDVKMKDSGIPWLGEIPEHWEVKKLKYLAKVRPSNVDKKSYDNEINVKLCNYIDVYRNNFITESIKFMEATANEDEISRFLLKIGDVLITKDSEDYNDIAVPAYVAQDIKDLLCGYHLAMIRPFENKLSGKYLFRLFQSKLFNAQFTVTANGITRYGLSISSIKDAFIPYFSLKEQNSIADNIDIAEKRIISTINTINKEISLLQEYRRALISEAVSGKIDVRNYKSNSDAEKLLVTNK